MWEAPHVAQIDPPTDAIVGDWLSLPDVADRLGLPVSRVRQLLRDRKLLAVQRPGGEFAVPAGFIDGDQVIHGLAGTLTLLFDCGFSDTEALSWLFTADDTLPGTPVQALAEHRRTEVNRRAQALAF
ncbi:MAG: Rv2175c family DNA-binding protein [Streptosporangiaceae bacterium]